MLCREVIVQLIAGEYSMTQAPAEIRDQVQQVAEFFAETLTDCQPGEMPDVPNWLSPEAQRWIISNHADFSYLVLSKHREFAAQP